MILKVHYYSTKEEGKKKSPFIDFMHPTAFKCKIATLTSSRLSTFSLSLVGMNECGFSIVVDDTVFKFLAVCFRRLPVRWSIPGFAVREV